MEMDESELYLILLGYTRYVVNSPDFWNWSYTAAISIQDLV